MLITSHSDVYYFNMQQNYVSQLLKNLYCILFRKWYHILFLVIHFWFIFVDGNIDCQGFCAQSDYYYIFVWWCNFFRWNVSAGAARPNPQGSFKYGQITVTEVYVILNRPAELINGKWRTTLNGISYLPPSTPLKLAQQFNIPGVYKLDFPNKLMNRPPKVDASLINGTFKGFIEIIFQNNDTTVQNYHLDGYAFFVVGWAFSFKNYSLSIPYYEIGKCYMSREFHISTVGWISEYGLKIAEAFTTNGMVLLAAPYRYSFHIIWIPYALDFDSKLLFTMGKLLWLWYFSMFIDSSCF